MAAPKLDKKQRKAHLYEVSRLYRQGMAVREIAERLDCSAANIYRDLQILREQWRNEMVSNVDQRQAEELAKLGYIERNAWEGWIRSRQDSEKIVERLPRGEDEIAEAEGGFIKERTRQGQSGDPRFLETARKVIEDRRKMLGLDAPSKIAPTDPTGKKEFSGVSDDELVTRFNRLSAILAGRSQGGDGDDSGGDGAASLPGE